MKVLLNQNAFSGLSVLIAGTLPFFVKDKNRERKPLEDHQRQTDQVMLGKFTVAGNYPSSY